MTSRLAGGKFERDPHQFRSARCLGGSAAPSGNVDFGFAEDELRPVGRDRHAKENGDVRRRHGGHESRRAGIVALLGMPIADLTDKEVPLVDVQPRLARLITSHIVDLSERQLERLFGDRAGLSPVVYARITRLHRGINASRRLPLALAAAVSGYADQAHFSREVRGLTGRTPRSLVKDVGSVQELELGSFYHPMP